MVRVSGYSNRELARSASEGVPRLRIGLTLHALQYPNRRAEVSGARFRGAKADYGAERKPKEAEEADIITSEGASAGDLGHRAGRDTGRVPRRGSGSGAPASRPAFRATGRRGRC